MLGFFSAARSSLAASLKSLFCIAAQVDRKPTADERLLRDFCILGAGFFIVISTVYVCMLSFTAPIPRDASTLVVGRDFLNFWMYGRASFLPDPGAWYDLNKYHQALDALLGNGYPGQNWSYPPTIMLLAAPFGMAGYLPALLIWTLLNLGIFIFVLRKNNVNSKVILAALTSPAAAFCLISGQSSLMITALLLGIFTLLDRKPILSGVLIGLLTLKPQLGILIPIILFATARWRVFASAALTTLAIFFLSLALFGSQSWVAYIRQGLPTQNLILVDSHAIATPFYPTIFMNLHGAGMNYAPAMAVQIFFAALAVGAVLWSFRRRRSFDRNFMFALFAACTITALPYLLIYDTLPMTLAMLLLLAKNQLDKGGRIVARFIYWLPLLQIGLGKIHVPGPALIAPVFALCIIARLKENAEKQTAEIIT